MRKMILLPLCLFLQATLFSQTNPFLSTNPEQETQIQNRGTDENSSPAGSPGPIFRRIAAAQRQIQRRIAQALSALSDPGASHTLMIILGFSFVYGFLHALGPGHRKTVLIGYFIGERVGPLTVIATGFLLALAHAGSAVVLVGGLSWLAVKSLLISVNQAEGILLPVSYGIITLLGFWMILDGWRHSRGSHEKEGKASRGLVGIVMSGLVPCPAAASIMIFSLASGVAATGILAVLAMSLGMGVLLVGIGAGSIMFRTGLTRVLSSHNRGRRLEVLLHAGGGLLIAVFGLIMFAGTFLS